MSSKAKNLAPPVAKMSLNLFLNGEEEPAVVDASCELGSIICLKLSLIGFTADIMIKLFGFLISEAPLFLSVSRPTF